jgi:hypothetical protein
MAIPFAHTPRRHYLSTVGPVDKPPTNSVESPRSEMSWGRGKLVAERRPSVYPFFSFSLTTIYWLLSTLLLSCTSPTPPPPPPPGPDTTSHDFIWHIDTLGDGNSSVLYDVAIINDTTIWAVGEIYLKDSSGQINPTVYGLTRWNGRVWDYERVAYRDFGPPQTYPGPLFAIQAFGPRDVYVCSYANLLHWDGSAWAEKAFFMTAIPFENQIQKMWGTSGTNLYCIGRKGGIFHFAGSSWQKIESGTTLPINDVWGSTDQVIAVASDKYLNQGRMLLGISAGTAQTLPDSGLPWSISSIWFVGGSRYYVGGDGLYETAQLGATWSVIPGAADTRYYKHVVRGNNTNDVFFAGSFGVMAHFNGSTWKG